MRDQATPETAATPTPGMEHQPVPIADVLDVMVRVSRATALRLRGPHPPGVSEIERVLQVRCARAVGLS